jgi:hypothetical protein
VAEHDPVVQRIPKRRALEEQHPERTEEIVEWLGAAARGRDPDPMPFERGGRRGPGKSVLEGKAMPREDRRACSQRPLRRRRRTAVEKW